MSANGTNSELSEALAAIAVAEPAVAQEELRKLQHTDPQMFDRLLRLILKVAEADKASPEPNGEVAVEAGSKPGRDISELFGIWAGESDYTWEDHLQFKREVEEELERRWKRYNS